MTRPEHQWGAFAEEALAALYSIAAFTAFNAGWIIMGWVLLVKAGMDTASAMLRWYAHNRAKGTK